MILTELTNIVPKELPIQGLRNHLRLGTGFNEDDLQDDLLELYLRSAIQIIEKHTGLILVLRSFMCVFNSREFDRSVKLPVLPVLKVTRVTLIDASGTKVELTKDSFRLDTRQDNPVVILKTQQVTGMCNADYIEVVFDAGYASYWNKLPSDLAHIVIILAAHFYENRFNHSNDRRSFPMMVTAVIETYRIIRIGRGRLR